MTNIDESFVLMVSFIIFSILAAKPLFIAVSEILQNKITEIKEKISSAESLRENNFKDLKKHKRSLTNAKRESEDHLNAFVTGVETSYRKHYTDLSVALEKKHSVGLQLVEIQHKQKVLYLYENLLISSSKKAEDYIGKNRTKLPSDIEIAKLLMSNI
jgi:F0F1-type ATP synthase membrane subunit b/b'